MENYNNNQGYELGWDATIVNDAPEYVVLPDGEYAFTVTKIERARFNGSEKMPACNMAKITCTITLPAGMSGVCTVTHNLLMHSRFEGRLSEFFTSIGMKKKGHPLQINWNVIGLKGRCKLGTRTYNGNTYNEIKSFLAPAEIPTMTSNTAFPWDN